MFSKIMTLQPCGTRNLKPLKVCSHGAIVTAIFLITTNGLRTIKCKYPHGAITITSPINPQDSKYIAVAVASCKQALMQNSTLRNMFQLSRLKFICNSCKIVQGD